MNWLAASYLLDVLEQASVAKAGEIVRFGEGEIEINQLSIEVKDFIVSFGVFNSAVITADGPLNAVV